MPARGVVVQLMGSQNEVLASTLSDGQGNYQFSVKANTQVKVRVLAQLKILTPAGRWMLPIILITMPVMY